jgi:hypothetical protein
MTNNVLWMILAFTIGLGTGQLIGNSGGTIETDYPDDEIHCYVNGQWVNPCPIPTPTPPFAPGGQIQQQ